MKKKNLKKHLVKFGNALLDKYQINAEVSHSDLENHFTDINIETFVTFKYVPLSVIKDFMGGAKFEELEKGKQS